MKFILVSSLLNIFDLNIQSLGGASVELPNNILVVIKSWIDFVNLEAILIKLVKLLGRIDLVWLDVEVFVHSFHV